MASEKRPEVLEGTPLHYAPENELGVVFLFSHLAKKWRVKVEQIRAKYPDCIAYQKAGGKEKKVRIEFEYKSKHFRTHGHDPKKCDWIVCWEHNWPAVPEHIEVVELRKEYGLGFNVWIQPVSETWKEWTSTCKFNKQASVSSLAHVGDLLIYYHTKPDMCLKDIFKIASPVRRLKAKHRKGMDYNASAKRVCHLKSPIFLQDLKRHKVLKTSFFVRSGMQGRPRATEYWPYLYAMIIKRNADVTKKLAKYAPDKI
jgi:hypothetical protein